jgi:hypothetical protein
MLARPCINVCHGGYGVWKSVRPLMIFSHNRNAQWRTEMLHNQTGHVP